MVVMVLGAARREDLISPQDLKTYLTFDSIDNEMMTNFNNQLDLNTDNNYF